MLGFIGRAQVSVEIKEANFFCDVNEPKTVSVFADRARCLGGWEGNGGKEMSHWTGRSAWPIF